MSEIDLMRKIEALEKRLASLETNEDAPIACRVYNSGNLTHTSSGNWLPLAMDSERWDTTGMHSTSTNNSYITIALGGWYLVGGCIQWAANATGARGLSVRLGGSTYIATNNIDNVGAGDVPQNVVNGIYYFAATNYIELCAYQVSGGNLVITQVGNYSPEFWAIRLP